MSAKTAIVLTDKPTAISPLLTRHGLHGIYLPSLRLLNKALVHDLACCGTLLDIRLVMRADATERSNLFALASSLPTVRWRLDADGKTPIFIDPLERLTGCTMAPEGPSLRAEVRASVRLDDLWARAEDPAMAESFEGVLLDISSSGAFLHAPNGLPESDFLNLRIMTMDERRPMRCAVRWRRPVLSLGSPMGVGLLFLDPTDAQRREITERWAKRHNTADAP
ncbi:MAG: PilZ domain-containing protein [Desulfovibrionaceae bacterium]